MADKPATSDSVSRRRFVKTVGASGAIAGIAGCAGGGDEGGDEDDDMGLLERLLTLPRRMVESMAR